MVRRLPYLIVVFLLLISAAWLVEAGAADGSDISVRALVDRNRVQPGEGLHLKVVVSGGDGVVDLAPLADFEVRSQGTATQISMVNLRTSREVTHTYLLIPRKTGRLTIPALTVDVDGCRLNTNPIQIEVAERADAGGSPRDIFVDVDVSHHKPYVGQQIRYTFTLFQGVQITDGRLEQPDFEGFEVHEFEDRPTRRKVLNGREYVVTEVSYLLIPLGAGSVAISPARLSFGLVKRQPRRRSNRLDDFFNFGRSQVEPRLLTSKSLQVEVRPLPAYRPPTGDTGEAAFSGLVGQFALSREVAQTALKVGESTTLAVKISGRGNIRDAQAPPLSVPPAFKIYTDTPSADVQLDGAGFSGEKVFRTALVPVTAGTHRLPESRLVYFDPVQGVYRESRGEAIDLAVTAGEPGSDTTVAVMASPGAGQASGMEKQRVAYTGKDLLPLKEGLGALETPRRLGTGLFWALLLVPALAFTFLGSALRLLKPAGDVRSRMRRKVREALKGAAASADGQIFLNALRRALVGAVMGATGGTGEALTADEARERLERGGVPADAAAEAARLLEEIDNYHYSGATLDDDARQRLRQQTQDLVRRVLK